MEQKCVQDFGGEAWSRTKTLNTYTQAVGQYWSGSSRNKMDAGQVNLAQEGSCDHGVEAAGFMNAMISLTG